MADVDDDDDEKKQDEENDPVALQNKIDAQKEKRRAIKMMEHATFDEIQRINYNKLITKQVEEENAD